MYTFLAETNFIAGKLEIERVVKNCPRCLGNLDRQRPKVIASLRTKALGLVEIDAMFLDEEAGWASENIDEETRLEYPKAAVATSGKWEDGRWYEW